MDTVHGDSDNGSFSGGTEISESEIDTLLPDYLIINEVRTDPYGKVFRGRQNRTQNLVSVRVFPIAESVFPGGVQGYNSYFTSYAQIQHRGLTEIVDFGSTAEGHLFLVTRMEESDLSDDRSRNELELASIYSDTLEVLDWLHTQGIPHGNLSPANLLIDAEGRSKLDGLGLAGLAGTLGLDFDSNPSPFHAPELSGTAEPTPQSDLYSLGVCLYASLTGSVPRGLLENPSEVNPNIDGKWDEIVASALKSDPAKRWPDATSFRDAILELNSGAPASETGTASPSPSPVLVVPGKTSPINPAPATSTGPNLNVPASGTSPQRPVSRSSRIPPKAPTPSPLPKIILFSALGLCCVAMLAFFLNRPPSDNKAGPVTPPIPYINHDLPRDDDPVEIDDVDRQARLSGHLVDLRILFPHCKNVQSQVERSRLIQVILPFAENLDQVVVGSEDQEVIEAILSDEFSEAVERIVKNARLNTPQLPRKSGTLVTWNGAQDSEKRGKEALQNFRGSDQKIVLLAGSPEVGLALSNSGKLSQWGDDSAPASEPSSIAFIDCEGSTFVTLSKSGEVTAWGSDLPGDLDLSEWNSVARVSAGEGFLLGIKDDFTVIAAGTNEANQQEIPKTVQDFPIVAVEAIMDTCFAVSADGKVFRWGGGLPFLETSVFAPRDVRSSGKSLYIRSMTDEIVKFDIFGEKTKEDFGAETEIFIPRFSPDESLFAYNRGTSRWVLSNKSDTEIDEAYWQETSRGAIDLLLGENSFVAAVPRAGSEPDDDDPEPENPVQEVTLDGIPVPLLASYREWTTVEGLVRRARILEIKDNTHVDLKLSDGSTATLPLDRFSEEDRRFAAEWEPLSELHLKKVAFELATLQPEDFLRDLGYEQVEWTLDEGDPLISLTVNDVPARLKIDTGATTSLITVDLADRAELSLREKVYALTWQGRVPTFKTEAREIGFGSARASNVSILAMDMRSSRFGSEGLLGLDLMQRVRGALDFGRNQFYLRQEDAKREEPITLETEYRDWETPDGSNTRAKLVRTARESVTLEASDGRDLSVPLSALGDSDREYLDAYEDHLTYLELLGQEREKLQLAQVYTRSSENWEEIPVSMQNNTQVIKVMLEGREMEFFIDTGASDTMLSIDAARDLGRNIRDMQVVGAASGIEGNRVPVFADEFGSFQIGGRIFHDFKLRVYDFENMTANRFSGTSYDGVIGTDLLIRLRAIIDMDRNEIVIPEE